MTNIAESMEQATISDDASCPCGSGRVYGECCAPILSGALQALTTVALMRSRYSAYVVGQIDYLATSLHPQYRQDLDLVATRRWSASTRWMGLEVVDTQGGGESDEEGMVEFIATYKEKDLIKPHRERANFRRYEGIWYYVDGEIVKPVTSVHTQRKTGRNDPCPCGSGKKFKKCCGR